MKEVPTQMNIDKYAGLRALARRKTGTRGRSLLDLLFATKELISHPCTVEKSLCCLFVEHLPAGANLV